MEIKKNDRYLNGYRLIYKPGYHRSYADENWNGYVYEHIYVAETFLGRHLLEDEEVHHLDWCRSNNYWSNLLVLCKSMHCKLHNFLDPYKGVITLETGDENRVNSGKPKVLGPHKCGNSLCSNNVYIENIQFCSQECVRIAQRKATRPSKSELEELIQTYPFTTIGKMFGVSDNAIRKWAKSYGIQWQS